jgi:peroxiredoxin Q/BCP
LAQLRQDYKDFVDRQCQIVVVGPESAPSFAAYWRDNDLPFIGLPDPAASVLKLYCQEVNLFKLGRMPAQVLIDRMGTARFAHYGSTMADIPSNREMLDLLDGLNREASRAAPATG